MNGYELKDRAARAGSHYFDPETMRFFNSRLGAVRALDDDRVLFVTSERPPHGTRRYSVRLAQFYRETRQTDGRIVERVDIGDAPGHEFQEFPTGQAANAALRRWSDRHNSN